MIVQVDGWKASRQAARVAIIAHLLTLLRALTADRARLGLENTALRQQLIVLKRSIKRPKIQDSDRVFWVLMRRMLKNWKARGANTQPTCISVVNGNLRGFGRAIDDRSSAESP